MSGQRHPCRSVLPGATLACGLLAAAPLVLGGCFSLALPAGAQITCSDEDSWCPGELICCSDGVCRSKKECASLRCATGGEPCEIEEAIDCAGLRICEQHCWSDCPDCQLVCDDPHYQGCQLDGVDERWYCLQSETCVVRISGDEGDLSYRADCHQPPDQCAGAERLNCGCLTAPFAVRPPCSPYEQCEDGYLSCVACRRGEIPTIRDADGGESVDGSDVYAPTGGPLCYDSLGANASGVTCCAELAAMASFSEASEEYSCAGQLFAVECGGFGQSCVDDTDGSCPLDEQCLWSWYGPAGLHCAENGPAGLCADEYGYCAISGSAARATCSCVASTCPG